MITSYKDMRLHHLLEIQALKDIDASDATKELMIVSILSGKTPDELRQMAPADYNALKDGAMFLTEPMPENKEIVDKVGINGTVFTICKDMQSISTGQYIDWCTYMSGEKRLTDLYSIMCIPEGHKYGEGYSLDDAKADMADLPLTAVNFISDFWNASQESYLRLLARQMKAEIRKLRRMRSKMTEEQKEALAEMEKAVMAVQYPLGNGGILSQLSTRLSATLPRR